MALGSAQWDKALRPKHKRIIRQFEFGVQSRPYLVNLPCTNSRIEYTFMQFPNNWKHESWRVAQFCIDLIIWSFNKMGLPMFGMAATPRNTRVSKAQSTVLLTNNNPAKGALPNYLLSQNTIQQTRFSDVWVAHESYCRVVSRT